jgi:hypothetical protein
MKPEATLADYIPQMSCTGIQSPIARPATIALATGEGSDPSIANPSPDMYGGLGDHPRRCATVRPGGGVHDERMAHVDVPGLAGGVRDRQTQRRRTPEDTIG